MSRLFVFFVLVIGLIGSSICSAKGGGQHSHSVPPGTGSKSSSAHVGSYTKKDGTHVHSHEKSTPDEKFQNNWTTKGNHNPVTGAAGHRVSKPHK